MTQIPSDVAGSGRDSSRRYGTALALVFVMPDSARIHFVGGVVPADILPLTAAADVSAMPVQGDTLSLDCKPELYRLVKIAAELPAN